MTPTTDDARRFFEYEPLGQETSAWRMGDRPLGTAAVTTVTCAGAGRCCTHSLAARGAEHVNAPT